MTAAGTPGRPFAARRALLLGFLTLLTLGGGLLGWGTFATLSGAVIAAGQVEVETPRPGGRAHRRRHGGRDPRP